VDIYDDDGAEEVLVMADTIQLTRRTSPRVSAPMTNVVPGGQRRRRPQADKSTHLMLLEGREGSFGHLFGRGYY
jgi:hypothetical protein